MLTLDKCEQMGADAAERLVSPLACPFFADTDEGRAWLHGYETVFEWVMSFYFAPGMVIATQTIH